MASIPLPKKLWQHPDPKSTDMYRLMEEINEEEGLNLKTYQELLTYSVNNRSKFYSRLFSFLSFIHTGEAKTVIDESVAIDRVPRWFEGVHLNWAENVLYSRGRKDRAVFRDTVGKEHGKVALTEVREGISSVQTMTWDELRQQAGQMAAAMTGRGVKVGDRIVLVGANSISTLVVLLAATWLGAIYSSSSTDMGVSGILQRTVQINPKFIFSDDMALYNGKTVDLREKMRAIVDGLKVCDQFEGVISINRFEEALDVSHIPKTETIAAFLSATPPSAAPPPFQHLSFSAPIFVYYSSGTTGIPKAIVHTVGGCLMTLAKEARLHHEGSAESVMLQYTTTGWIMYLANIQMLLLGARVVLYDGSPFVPDPGVLVRLAAEQRVTNLGVNPRWMLEIKKRDVVPKALGDLSALRIVTSSGMVLSDMLFEWFYSVAFPPYVHLANMSGGTDIAGCFGMENPLTPVYVGGTQGGALGIAIAVYDVLLPNGPGKPVPDGTAGELVATAAFPNMPCYLWADSAPAGTPADLGPAVPGTSYHKAYFARFDGVWAHGDFCRIDPRTGNVAFLGRSDGVLNPSGIRFGSAEIYSVMETFFAAEVADSLCVGRRRPEDDDEAVMLFLLLKDGKKLDDTLVATVKTVIGRELSKRHVPRFVFSTPEIPTTVNLKKVEAPVKQIVSGYKVKPSGTLLNPHSLEYYYQFSKVEHNKTDNPKL